MTLIPLKKHETSLSRKTGDFFSPFQKEMNRLMDDFFSNFPSLSFEATLPLIATPAVNISENDKAYSITAELPGIQEKDIEISVTNGNLQIKGEKEISNEEKENGFISMERSYGSFYRSIPFGASIDEGRIKAVLKDGVLTVDVPKSVEAIKNAKKIQIHKG